MSFEEFKKEIVFRIKDFLPEVYHDSEIRINTITKNNDQKLDGLSIRLKDSNIAPNIYLNSFFEQHESGRPMEDILREIAGLRVSNEVATNFDLSRITDFDRTKDHITCRLVNAEKNDEYLKDKPHTKIGDLAATYHIHISSGMAGQMTTPVTSILMKDWGINEKELHDMAIDNMERISPASFKSMNEVLAEMMGDMPPEAREAMFPDDGKPKMWVLTNTEKIHGAAALLSSKAMDEVVSKVGEDFYILPSSIHEVLIVPHAFEGNLATLEDMVKDVNSSQVALNEQLSDHVYAYDAKTHEIYRADQAQERKQERIPLDERLAQSKDMVENQGNFSKKSVQEHERG